MSLRNEVERVALKTTAHKLDVQPAEFIVSETRVMAPREWAVRLVSWLPRTSVTSMRVVSWNMGCGHPRFTARYRKVQDEAWRLLFGFDPDVILVQEALLQLPEWVGREGTVAMQPPGYDGQDSGCGILVRRGQAAARPLMIPGSYAAAAEVTVAGTPVYFASVHVSTEDHQKNLRAVIDVLPPEVSGRRFVVGGDFNAAPHYDRVYKKNVYGWFFESFATNGFHDCHFGLHAKEVQSFWGRQAKEAYQDDHFLRLEDRSGVRAGLPNHRQLRHETPERPRTDHSGPRPTARSYDEGPRRQVLMGLVAGRRAVTSLRVRRSRHWPRALVGNAMPLLPVFFPSGRLQRSRPRLLRQKLAERRDRRTIRRTTRDARAGDVRSKCRSLRNYFARHAIWNLRWKASEALGMFHRRKATATLPLRSNPYIL